ncbi:LOW QUALITY PROTEIN: hypothetical protein QTO34_003456 [Cnephaeus nilssonii]|uniref:Uncharacterized protein n=1 Tax=Cnephaeus nilssonii TaxID=3371016 RepID=A0AA40HQV6_CNENI|nr:LOW QUALITY PROTEIN: hypothetical protein QTO34_003456 [Eptesicus nilssonii]
MALPLWEHTDHQGAAPALSVCALVVSARHSDQSFRHSADALSTEPDRLGRTVNLDTLWASVNTGKCCQNKAGAAPITDVVIGLQHALGKRKLPKQPVRVKAKSLSTGKAIFDQEHSLGRKADGVLWNSSSLICKMQLTYASSVPGGVETTERASQQMASHEWQ